MGAEGRSSEVQDASTKPHVATQLHRRIRNSTVVQVLELEWTLSEPAKRKHHPEQTRLRQTLCPRYGTYDAPLGALKLTQCSNDACTKPYTQWLKQNAKSLK